MIQDTLQAASTTARAVVDTVNTAKNGGYSTLVTAIVTAVVGAILSWFGARHGAKSGVVAAHAARNTPVSSKERY